LAAQRYRVSTGECRSSRLRCRIPAGECRLPLLRYRLSMGESRLTPGECRVSVLRCRESAGECCVSTGEYRLPRKICRLSERECRESLRLFNQSCRRYREDLEKYREPRSRCRECRLAEEWLAAPRTRQACPESRPSPRRGRLPSAPAGRSRLWRRFAAAGRWKLGTDTPRRLQAIHLRHLQVHQDQVVRLAAQSRKDLDTIAGQVGPVAQPLQ
jgi:hypothetical protein